MASTSLHDMRQRVCFAQAIHFHRPSSSSSSINHQSIIINHQSIIINHQSSIMMNHYIKYKSS